MNKAILFSSVLILTLLTTGCKKDKFEHKPIDFSYADDLAGTYVGVRKKDGPLYWGSPPGTYQSIDTITVIVEDRRTEKVCTFHIGYFNKEYIIKPNKYFINESTTSGGGSNSYRETYVGYFKDGILYYSKKHENLHYTGSYYPIIMKLYKQ